MNRGKGSKIFGLSIVVIVFLFFMSDPIEIFFYKSPKKSDILYSAGIVKLEYAYKAGQRIRLKTEDGMKVLTCRVASSGLMQSGTCPFSKADEAAINGHDTVVGWYKQTRWPLTSSELQVFSISVGNRRILDFDEMVDFYLKENKKFRAGSILIYFILFVFILFVVRNILKSGDK